MSDQSSVQMFPKTLYLAAPRCSQNRISANLGKFQPQFLGHFQRTCNFTRNGLHGFITGCNFKSFGVFF